MASNTTKLTGDKVFKFTVNGDEEDSALDEDDFDKEKQSSHQSFDELESDLKKNKHCTDADVLKAVSVFSERASPVNPSDRQITRKTCISFFPFSVLLYCFVKQLSTQNTTIFLAQRIHCMTHLYIRGQSQPFLTAESLFRQVRKPRTEHTGTYETFVSKI
jgi:hypothetical protein